MLENIKYVRFEGKSKDRGIFKRGRGEIKWAVVRELEKFFIYSNGQRKRGDDLTRKDIPLGIFIWGNRVKHWRMKSKIIRRPLFLQEGF